MTHFSMQVLEDQSAYILAAGSSFARSPTTHGLLLSVERPCFTSAKSPFEIPPAKMTLHVGGRSVLAIAENQVEVRQANKGTKLTWDLS